MLRNVFEAMRTNTGPAWRRCTGTECLLVRARQSAGCSAPVQHSRFKYTQHQGVKGIRNRKSLYELRADSNAETTEVDDRGVHNDGYAEALSLDDREYDEVANNAMNVTRDLSIAQNVLIIQPFVKWGPKRQSRTTTPDDQLREAEALIHSLPHWRVVRAVKVPLESLERKSLFGTGKMEELKTLVQQLRQGSTGEPLTCLFVSKGALSFAQKRVLEAELQLPVMDRYSVVIQILRLHATSAEARIQVAMAEIPYIWAQAKDANATLARKLGYSLNDTQREILKTRERKLRQELERIRSHRKLLRNKRKQKNYPIVAVVGYTNAGKTSLIKALTNEQAMQPRNQLFATLDVTAHAGVLPCNLEIIYMDTVGFMSDLPTGLIECFIATLEDAMLADVIVHVQDLAHVCCAAQRQHVEATLQTLSRNCSTEFGLERLPPIINVGNKIDLLPVSGTADAATDSDTLPILRVSAKVQTGLEDLLVEIEQNVLAATGRRKILMRVQNGGQEMAWLFKNAAVVDMRVDESNAEQLLMSVVIAENTLQLFRRQFCQ